MQVVDWTHYTYLALNIFTISFPLVRSFEPRLHYVQYWPSVIVGTIFMGLVFIPWDIWFTAEGVWSFNHSYVVGIYFFGLPLEEWLFFLTVPFACAFIYEVVRFFWPKLSLPFPERNLIGALFLFFVVMAIFNQDRLYTLVNFSVGAIALVFHYVLFKGKKFAHFFLAYLLSVIPFLLVNGVLTAIPIVSYNNAENLGLRLFTIPVEDLCYSFTLLLLTVTVHEKTKPLFKTRETKQNEPAGVL